MGNALSYISKTNNSFEEKESCEAGKYCNIEFIASQNILCKPDINNNIIPASQKISNNLYRYQTTIIIPQNNYVMPQDYDNCSLDNNITCIYNLDYVTTENYNDYKIKIKYTLIEICGKIINSFAFQNCPDKPIENISNIFPIELTELNELQLILYNNINQFIENIYTINGKDYIITHLLETLENINISKTKINPHIDLSYINI